MSQLLNYPLLVFVLSFFLLWFSARIGTLRRNRPEGGVREDFDTIRAAALTLLGLIIGFSFSMAVARYDLRKSYEAEEANAIGTEYARADLLPTAEAAQVKVLLRDYLDQRISLYTTRSPEVRKQVNMRMRELQAQLWAVVAPIAKAQPTPTVALAVAGMNDVLNSADYAKASWLNRIPAAAWILMESIAVCCCAMIGFGTHKTGSEGALSPIFPLIVSISFFLIADIDSPNGGVIRVHPQNLESLAASLQPQ